jgi:Tfp pilus assembly protein FimT
MIVQQHRTRARGGLTLLEMLLVLAVLVAVVGITSPALNRMYESHRLQQSVNEVLAKLGAARLHAIDDGVVYEFRFEPRGRNLLIVPHQDARHRLSSETLDSAKQLNRWTFHGELPEGLAFGKSNTQERISTRTLQQLSLASSLTRVAWSPAVLFLPNGSSSHAAFQIDDGDGRTVAFAVRGLTGAASATAARRREKR